MNASHDPIVARKRTRIHPPTRYAVIGMAFLLLILMVLHIMLGEQNTGFVSAVRALWGHGDAEQILIVQTLRAPRAIVAGLVGAALAVSGAILQGVIRNPLAAPDVMGITGGASVGSVVFITVMSNTFSIQLMPLAGILGAFIAAFLIYIIAWRNGVNPLRLVLVGIGISSLMSALTSFMLVFSPEYSASSVYIWLTGTVYGSSWEHVWTLLPWLIICTLFVSLFMKSMNIQLLQDEVAIALGSQVQRNRMILVLISVCFAGAAVSVGGVIGFVGLIAPHAARRMVGPVFSRLIPVSALFGAKVVMLADLIARTAFQPYDIPVGVFTSGVGAPFFIYLLYRSRKRQV